MKDRLKKLRRDLGITQTEFARRIGSVQNTITGYESGRRSPSGPVLAAICKEFNVNEEWLKTGEGEMYNPDASAELELLAKKYGLSTSDYILVEKFVNMAPSRRKVIVDFIREAASAFTFDEGTEDQPNMNEISLDSAALEAAYQKSSDTVSHIRSAEASSTKKGTQKDTG